MSLAISALRAEGEVLLRDAEVVSKSYPDFYEAIESLLVK